MPLQRHWGYRRAKGERSPAVSATYGTASAVGLTG